MHVTRPLTAKGMATRGRIIEAAARLIRADGVEHTGLEAVLDASSTSKGQLFHYFPDGRADLLYAVAVHEANQVIADQQPYLDSLGPDGTWQAWRDAVVARYRVQGRACPLTALTSQLRQSEPRIGPLIVGLLDDWHSRIAAGLRRWQTDGGRLASGGADAVGAVILTAIQGGASLLTSTGQIDYLETALDASLAYAGVSPLDPAS